MTASTATAPAQPASSAGAVAGHAIVDADQWISARKALLAREKELTHLRDAVARERRALPWRRVEQDYVFDTASGPRRLADLFDGRRQLLVQHFMLGPGWVQGCQSCSYMADHLGGMQVHLAHRDVTLLVVSRAPLAEIERFRQRMGWQFRWVSSFGNAFNFDFAVSFAPQDQARGEVDYNYRRTRFPSQEAPGISVFVRNDQGEVFHTYSTYGRGVEVMMGTYQLLDLTPKGRDEHNPNYPMDWVRHHDRYDPQGGDLSPTGPQVAAAPQPAPSTEALPAAVAAPAAGAACCRSQA